MLKEDMDVTTNKYRKIHQKNQKNEQDLLLITEDHENLKKEHSQLQNMFERVKNDIKEKEKSAHKIRIMAMEAEEKMKNIRQIEKEHSRQIEEKNKQITQIREEGQENALKVIRQNDQIKAYFKIISEIKEGKLATEHFNLKDVEASISQLAEGGDT